MHEFRLKNQFFQIINFAEGPWCSFHKKFHSRDSENLKQWMTSPFESSNQFRMPNGEFEDVDDIKEVKLITTNDFRNIVDKITTSDEETLSGLININTAPLEVLQILPGMDETKAQAIITYRESESEDSQQNQTADQTEIQGNPFKNIADVLDVEGIDSNSFKEISGRITYRSYGSMIKSSGMDLRGRTIALCVGVIDRTGDQVQIKYWKQE